MCLPSINLPNGSSELIFLPIICNGIRIDCFFLFRKKNALFPISFKVETKIQLSWACRRASWAEKLFCCLAEDVSSGHKWLEFASVWAKKATDQICCASFQAHPFSANVLKR